MSAYDQPNSDTEYSFARQKLPKTLSHPLKRSVLDAALRSAGVYSVLWYVLYARRHDGATLLDAHFGPEPDGYAGGKVMLTIWAVAAGKRKDTEDLLIAEGLPLLCRWLATVQAEGNAWRGFRHSLTLQRVDGRLRYIEQ